jgi:hypothetical protein
MRNVRDYRLAKGKPCAFSMAPGMVLLVVSH